MVLSLIPSSWVLWYLVIVGSAYEFPGRKGSYLGI